MLNVYLAGAVRGTYGGWRARMPQIANVRFMHPGAAIPAGDDERRSDLYGPADRISVGKCDILLAHPFHREAHQPVHVGGLEACVLDRRGDRLARQRELGVLESFGEHSLRDADDGCAILDAASHGRRS